MLTITDHHLDITGTPIATAACWIAPEEGFLDLDSGVWVDMAATPHATQTAADGSWTLSAPWPSASSTVRWRLTAPAGTVWCGLVPEGVAGPLTLHDLATTYGWETT